MNKQQFEALSPEVQVFVEAGYRDGYTAAVDLVRSCVQRIGDDRVDKIFIYNRDTIVSMLEMGLK